MEVRRPGPGERLNTTGTPVEPRQAATVILIRGDAETLEVLLVERNPAQRFMGGAWVFPGGAVDAGEADGDEAHRVAAIREAQEEAGLTLGGPDELVKFSRWITPAQIAMRFDTQFFLAASPPGQEAVPDGQECVDLAWFTPAGALEAYERGEISLVFPTIKHLEQLSAFSTAEELLAYARTKEVVPVEPRVITGGETARIVLPGEPGYDDD